MSLTVTDSPSIITVPSGSKVTVKDAIVIVQGGVEVVKLDAEYDLADVPSEFHQIILDLMINRRMRLGMQSWEAMEADAKRAERYRQRKATYAALPWYKKLITSRPWSFDPENDEVE